MKTKKRIAELNKLYKRNNELCRNVSSAVNLSETTFWILYFLRYDGVHTQKDLCDVSFQPRQTVNSSIKKLEAEGYITLSFAKANRKNKIVTLTEKGEKLACQTADKVLAAELKTFSLMNDDEIEQLLRLYNKYLTILEAEIENIGQKKDAKYRN